MLLNRTDFAYFQVNKVKLKRSVGITRM